MKEKQAFLGAALGIAAPILGGFIGSAKLTGKLAPHIANFAKKRIVKGPASRNLGYLGRKKNNALKWMGKTRGSEDIASQLGFTAGGMGGSMVAAPFLMGEGNQDQDMQKYSELKLKGFIKAAMEADLSPSTTVELTKRAFGESDLKPEDIARIRMALQDEGVPAPYSDPNGPLNSNYNQNILRARDNSIDQIPEVEGSLAAARKGLLGAGLGGLGGFAAGKMLNAPNVLGSGVPYGLKKNLPGALGTSGVILGALLSALPAYKQKVDQVKGLQKLNYPDNMQKLIENIQTDKALLAS